MRKLWFVERVRPLALVDYPPAEAEGIPVVVPGKRLEKSGFYGPALVRINEGGDAWFSVRTRDGRARSYTRPVIAVDDVRPGTLALFPTGHSQVIDNVELEVWGPVLVTASPVREIDRPWEVERYAWEVRWNQPEYNEGKVWGTAWSIYCAYKAPRSRHCKQGRYFDEFDLH